MKPEVSIMAGLATAGVVYGVYNNATPSVADIRVAPPHDQDIEAARKMAAWTAAAAVGGISLIAKDATIFIMGAAMIVALDWWHRHANEVDPRVSAATPPDVLPVATQESEPSDYGYDGEVVTGGAY